MMRQDEDLQLSSEFSNTEVTGDLRKKTFGRMYDIRKDLKI